MVSLVNVVHRRNGIFVPCANRIVRSLVRSEAQTSLRGSKLGSCVDMSDSDQLGSLRPKKEHQRRQTAQASGSCVYVRMHSPCNESSGEGSEATPAQQSWQRCSVHRNNTFPIAIYCFPPTCLTENELAFGNVCVALDAVELHSGFTISCTNRLVG